MSSSIDGSSTDPLNWRISSRVSRQRAAMSPAVATTASAPEVGAAAEDVVGLDELVEREMVGDEPAGIDLMARDQLEQRWRGVGVDQAGGNGDVLDPQLLQMEGGWFAVHADVGHPTARADQCR